MSDKEHLEQDRQHAKPEVDKEPQAGEGSRSLMNWQNLARARESLSINPENRERYQADPVSYMQRFGVDASGMAPEGPATAGPQVHNLQSGSQGAEMQLAFCKVWGIVIVVAAAAAAAVAAVVANAAAGVNAVAVANANVTANVNGVGPSSEG